MAKREYPINPDKLTHFEYLFIKYIRIRLDGTWRYVSAMYKNRYIDGKPFFDGMTNGGNQILGMDLCNAAMSYFNETPEDGWN